MAGAEGRRLSALVDAGLALAGEVELDALLQRIADLSREVLDARYGAVGVLGETENELAQFVFSGIDKETADRIGDLPIGRGVLGALIDEGRPLRLREISDHPRSYGFPDNHPPMNSFLGVPIIVKGRIFGRLYLTEKIDGVEFSKDDERIALTLAAQAGVAIENARLLDEIRDRSDELAQRITEVERLREALADMAVLEERERIARDLHDGVIQSIYSVGLSLQGALGLLAKDPDGVSARVNAAITELDNVVRDVRGYIFELQPKLVEEKGFSAAIEELVKDLEINTLAETTVTLEGDLDELIEEKDKIHLIQFAREALSNIARHAQASHVEVFARAVGGGLQIRIEDDGIGFDPGSVQQGHGLKNMEDRAGRLGGTLEILPRAPRGTTHLVVVPGIGRGA